MRPIRNISHPKKVKISNRARISILNLQNRIPVDQASIKRVIQKVLSTEAPKDSGLVNITIVNDRVIKKINKLYLNHNFATDVLAFDLSDSKRRLFCPDIVVSADTAYKNSKVFHTSPTYELFLYIIHGILHILGYDDKTF